MTRKQTFTQSVVVASLLAAQWPALAGTYLGGFQAEPERLTHPQGYAIGVKQVVVNVCIDPSSAFQSELEDPLVNAIRTWNRQEPALDNLGVLASNNGQDVDIESTLVHELGHCVFGFDHTNSASESGLSDPESFSTKSFNGPNGVLDVNAGPDNVHGTADDVRGDDINKFWFASGVNDPFDLNLPQVIDKSTYTLDLAGLPPGDSFAANGHRGVSVASGYPETESVMDQGRFGNETQRELTADDVAMVRLSQSGFDGTYNTSDDYEVYINYIGVTDVDCDIPVVIQGGNSPNCQITADINPPGGSGNSVLTSGVVTLPVSPIAGDNWFFNEDQDPDGDTILNINDNCRLVSNVDQTDTNGDGFGNICDPDFTGDCLVDNADLALLQAEFFGTNPEFDLNGDGVVNVGDLGIFMSYFGERVGPGATDAAALCPILPGG